MHSPARVVELARSDPALDLSPRGKTMLQERLATYALTVLAIALGYWPAFYAVWAGHPEIPNSTVVAHILSPRSFALLLLHGSLWLICRGRPLPATWLPALDVAYHAGVGIVFGRIVAGHPSPTASVFEGLLALTSVLSLRALVVPSSVVRTALAGALACAGPGLALFLDGEHFSTPWLEAHTARALFVNWSVIAIALSSVASGVLYGLRREVRDARRLGQYTLSERLGQGGMGVVYRAEHALLRRPTAVKLLPHTNSVDSLTRFEREVQLMAQLTHPNTVAVYDYGRTAGGVFYYAMEYLDGVDLQGLVSVSGAQPAARVIHLVRQVCGSLDEAHRRGIVHRDVKPANVFLCRGRSEPDTVKVLDFGLVKDLSGASPALTMENAVLGTPLYMAPEALARPDRVGPASDIYSLGALAYFLITGTPVFPSQSLIEICARQLHEAPEPPSRRLGASIAPDLEAVLLSCLAKAPGERPASAAALRALLDACVDAGGWTEQHVEIWWGQHALAIAARQKERAGSQPTERQSVQVDVVRGILAAQ